MDFRVGYLSDLALAWSCRVRPFELSSVRIGILCPHDRNYASHVGLSGRARGAEEATAASRCFYLHSRDCEG